MAFTEDVMWTVGRHFVTLSCVQQFGDGKEKNLVFSGFVVEIEGLWFYITAGHIIRDIKRAVAAGTQFETWRLGDQAARKFTAAIPFDFQVEQWLQVEDEAKGLDYAAVLIQSYYRMHLEAGGIVAIEANAWGDYTTDFDFRALVGVPSESVKQDGQARITHRLVMAKLLPAEAPSLAGPKAANQFYATLAPDSEAKVPDVDGMSGGPIFGLKRVQDEWRYQVIGVQSGWYANSRIVAGCPFSSFGHELAEIVREAIARVRSMAGGSGVEPSEGN